MARDSRREYPYPAGLNYFTILPSVANTYDNQTRSDRFIVGTSADYRPVPWFSNKFRVGLDMNIGRAELYFPPQPGGLDPFSARASFDLVNTKGFIAQGRPFNQDFTINYDGTVTRELTSSLVSNSSFGVQFLSNAYHRTDAYGQDLGSLGIRSVSAAAVTTGGEQDTTQKSIGFYVQQQAAWRDRLFLTGAVRVDNNSAFGSKLNHVFYPKASLSWVISEEPFFHLPTVDQLRLRFAWGQAGNSPGPFDAIRAYTTSVVTGPTGTSSALRYASVGNPNLRPERGSEIELGFESSLVGGRLGLEATYYNKTTRDALLQVAVPPSTGFAGTQLQNLGKISNTGFEVVFNATPLRRTPLTIETTLSLATNHNKLVSFGDDRAPIVFGDYAPVQRYQEGFPLAAYWAQRVQYDANGNLVKNAAGQPIIDPVSVYMGPSVPTREMSFSNDFIVFEKLRLHSLFDYKGGHYMFNVKDWRRDRAGLSWATVNPQANPDEVLARDVRRRELVRHPEGRFPEAAGSVAQLRPPRRVGRTIRGSRNADARGTQPEDLDQVRRCRSRAEFQRRHFDVQPQRLMDGADAAPLHLLRGAGVLMNTHRNLPTEAAMRTGPEDRSLRRNSNRDCRMQRCAVRHEPRRNPGRTAGGSSAGAADREWRDRRVPVRIRSVRAVVGVLSDEAYTDHTNVDVRDFSEHKFGDLNTINSTTYEYVQRARQSADDATDRLKSLLGAAASCDLNVARVLAYGGYSYVLLGEGWCESPVNLSAPLSSDSLLRRAIAHFDEAITVATAGSPGSNAAAAQDIINMSRVGAARAALKVGRRHACEKLRVAGAGDV